MNRASLGEFTDPRDYSVSPVVVAGFDVDGHGGQPDERQGVLGCVVQLQGHQACIALRRQDAEAAALQCQDIAGAHRLKSCCLVQDFMRRGLSVRSGPGCFRGRE